ncbi:MAG: phosphatidylserine decarboxylase [Clostridia bacterium]|nr:phosphatidylserine decarboxylase [Clostridia bacterium]
MSESKSVIFLYNNAFGRLCLKIIKRRWLSRLCGKYLDSRLSKHLIKKFVKKNNIDLSQYYADDFKCFNDCFCRQIREGYRPIDAEASALISPCDGLLTAYSISGDTVLPVKQSKYTIASLLRDEKLAERFEDGLCLIFRLCVDNYHRYCYFDGGKKEDNVFIPGFLHTVRPTALEALPVFVENCREYTLMHTDNFGDAVQIEVGAMLVGKIDNYHGVHKFARGEEKGRFLYGGSTVILLIEKGRASVDEAFKLDSGEEIPVVMGQRIGRSYQNE